MKFTSIVKLLKDGYRLSEDEGYQCCCQMLDSTMNSEQIAFVLSLLSSRSLGVHEVLGFRKAIMERGVKLDPTVLAGVDVCGTGGDGKSTFNISTASAFVVASLGVPVVKHGNYAVSSTSGSSNILESLGYKFKTDQDSLIREVDLASVCFLHAPLFYPGMKSVSGVRKALGVKTIFNVLGPLMNPAKAQCQLSGVFNLEVLRLYSEVFPQIVKSYFVVHSLDGYDEVSLTSKARIISNHGLYELDPVKGRFMDAEIVKVSPQSIELGKEVPKEVFLKFLKGQSSTEINEVVAVNAALATMTYSNISFHDAKYSAIESILAGKPYEVLVKLIESQG